MIVTHLPKLDAMIIVFCVGKDERKRKMLLDRASLSIVGSSAKTDCRYVLNGICVEPSGVTVATDTHQLMIMEPMEPEAEHRKKKRFVINQKTVKSVLREIGKANDADPVDIKTSGKNISATISKPDRETKIKDLQLGGKFPEWREIFKTRMVSRNEPDARYTVSVLRQALESLEKALGKGAQVDIYTDKESSTVFSANDISGERNAIVLVMPVIARDEDRAKMLGASFVEKLIKDQL